MVLRVHDRDPSIGGDDVDHRRQPRGLNRSSRRASVISRTTPLYCRITFAVSNWATLVCATVRTLLFAPPYASTSLNAETHRGSRATAAGQGGTGRRFAG